MKYFRPLQNSTSAFNFIQNPLERRLSSKFNRFLSNSTGRAYRDFNNKEIMTVRHLYTAVKEKREFGEAPSPGNLVRLVSLNVDSFNYC